MSFKDIINTARASWDSLEGGRKKGVLVWCALFLFLWSMGLGLLSLYLASHGCEYWLPLLISYIKSPLLLFLNLLPCLLLAGVFFFAFGRVWGGVLGSFAFVMLPSLVNYYKIMLRNDPLLAADITLVSEAADMVGNYEISLTLPVVLCLLCCLAGFLVSVFFAKLRVRGVKRLAGLVLSLALAALAFFGLYLDDDIYSSSENIERNAWFLSQWSDKDQFISRGFVYPFLHSAESAVELPPEGYDEDEAASMLSGYEDGVIPEDKKINIIAIMLEAYNDFSSFDTLTFVNDPYEYFHKLQKESISGRLVTNIFAGGTIDTERSFITGYPNMTQYRKSIPTYASYMASQGYTVEGGHPGYDWFYNRRNVAEYFGFENYYFFEDRYKTDGTYLMEDMEFFEDILGLYQQAVENGENYFNFSVTYQNHGPYASDYLYDPSREYVVTKGYSFEAYNILNNYFLGIDMTDRAIENLIESLRESPYPTAVVIFGDHNPWLGDNSFVFEEIGVSLDRGTTEGFYNYYCTPYVIWANDSAKETLSADFQGDGGDMSPCFLMNRLFEECGYRGSAYMQYASDVYQSIDVINSSGLIRLRETGQLTAYPDEQTAAVYNDFLCLEYFMKHDYFSHFGK